MSLKRVSSFRANRSNSFAANTHEGQWVGGREGARREEPRREGARREDNAKGIYRLYVGSIGLWVRGGVSVGEGSVGGAVSVGEESVWGWGQRTYNFHRL